jgi:hypothetical protein
MPMPHFNPTWMKRSRGIASRAACKSSWVQQELGAAFITQKKLLPIVWDMLPSEFPGWVTRNQALDLRQVSLDDVRSQMTAVAQRIKSDKAQGLLICGVLIAGLVALKSSLPIEKHMAW